MKKSILSLLCTGIVMALAACGAAEDKRLTPAETLAVTEMANISNADAEIASAEENAALPEEDENPIFGAWQYEDHSRTEVILFGEQQKMLTLGYRRKEALEPYMTFENGEMRNRLAPDLLTDITRDEDIADFRIYEMMLEEGTEYYILDKNGEIFHTYGANGCTYALTSDTLTFVYAMQDGAHETMAVEFVDSNTVLLTEQTDGAETVLMLTRADHLYPVMHYFN